MRDVTKIDFGRMNDDLRVELILAFMNEAVQSEWTDEEQDRGVRAIISVPNGEPIIGCDDEDKDEKDMTDIEYVALVIDYHYGNMV